MCFVVLFVKIAPHGFKILPQSKEVIKSIEQNGTDPSALFYTEEDKTAKAEKELRKLDL